MPQHRTFAMSMTMEQLHKISRSKVKVGAIEGHEHSAVRTHGSTAWSPTDIEDMCSTGASQEQGHIFGGQRKCRGLGTRTESKFQTFCIPPGWINS